MIFCAFIKPVMKYEEKKSVKTNENVFDWIAILSLRKVQSSSVINVFAEVKSTFIINSPLWREEAIFSLVTLVYFSLYKNSSDDEFPLQFRERERKQTNYLRYSCMTLVCCMTLHDFSQTHMDPNLWLYSTCCNSHKWGESVMI